MDRDEQGVRLFTLNSDWTTLLSDGQWNFDEVANYMLLLLAAGETQELTVY